MAEFGYAGEILKVDLSSGKYTLVDTSIYSDKFIGGKGLAAKIYWDMVPPEARALSPENCLIFSTGPTTTFQCTNRKPFRPVTWEAGGGLNLRTPDSMLW